MGDRTAFTFTAPGLDGLSKKRKAKLAALLDEVSGGSLGGYDPDSGFDTLPTDRWASNTWVWTEIRCGIVQDVGITGLQRVINRLTKWGLDPAGTKIWEDPKYEWLGDSIEWDGHRFIWVECDSEGDRLLRETTIPESALVSHRALGEFVASHFGFTVEGEGR